MVVFRFHRTPLVPQGTSTEKGYETCWLCLRPLGQKAELYHLLPKSRGGRMTVRLHPICHRTIHVNFSNAELARTGTSHESLMANIAIGKFVKWVGKKPPNFHATTRKGR